MDSREASELLVGEALEFGAPDNVTVVVVDVIAAELQTDFVASPRFVGSAANEVVIEERKGNRTLKILNPLNLLELLKKVNSAESYVPESDEFLEKIIREAKRRIWWRKVRQILTVLVLIAMVVVGVKFAYDYTQTRYYVGVQNDRVTIFKGVKESLGPLMLSSPFRQSDLSVSQLNSYQINLLERTITATDLEDAERILKLLESSVDK
jgi:protein phosphatase